MNPTAPQFAWSTLGYPDFAPDDSERANDPVCWLCGGATTSGWRRDWLLSDTFTNHPLARAPKSRTICQPCAAFLSSQTWAVHAAKYGLKDKHPISWRTYSHLFSREKYLAPNRAQIRELLLDPPNPPFLLVITTSGQKHLIFRARIAYSHEMFPIQFEEEMIFAPPARIAQCLTPIEALLELGFSKAQVESGHYHDAQIRKAGLKYRALELAAARFRERDNAIFRLAVFCARGKEKLE